MGHAKINRLLFIAEKKQGTAFGDDALKLALEELSQVQNCCCSDDTRIPDQTVHTQVLLTLQSENTLRYQEVALRFGGNVNRCLASFQCAKSLVMNASLGASGQLLPFIS